MDRARSRRSGNRGGVLYRNAIHQAAAANTAADGPIPDSRATSHRASAYGGHCSGRPLTGLFRYLPGWTYCDQDSCHGFRWDHGIADGRDVTADLHVLVAGVEDDL